MYFDYDAHGARVVLRGYFIVFGLMTAAIGNECCKALVKFDLLRNRQVRLHRTTGWLSELGFLTSLWDLKNLPGGKIMGVLMLLLTTLAPVADLAVSGFVRDVHVQSRCQFGQGIVLNSSAPFQFTGPPVNGLPQTVAATAQRTSVANGGLQGIYWKVNSDTNFAAEPQDVLAQWVCLDVEQDIDYGTDEVRSDLILDLQNRSYLYAEAFYISLGSSPGHYEHLVAWSSDATFAPWNVKASIDISALPTDSTVMRSFACSINSHAADDILSSMNTTWTLIDWLQGFQGGCYEGSNTPARADAGTFIEQYLNSMLMVQAGGNYLLSSPRSDSDPTQGCLAVKAKVPVLILFLVSFLGALFLGLFSFLGIVRYKMKRSRRQHAGGRPIGPLLDLVPHGLTSWMLHAARESAMHRHLAVMPAKASELANWSYAVTNGLSRLVHDQENLNGNEQLREEGENLEEDEQLGEEGEQLRDMERNEQAPQA